MVRIEIPKGTRKTMEALQRATQHLLVHEAQFPYGKAVALRMHLQHSYAISIYIKGLF